MGDIENAHKSFSKDLPVLVEGQIKWRGIKVNAPNHKLCRIEISNREVLCNEESVTEEDLPTVSNRWKQLRNAGRIQSNLRHPNVQRFYGAICTRNTFSIVLENGFRGHCDEFMKQMVSNSVNGLTVQRMKCKIALEVVEGAEYLHGLAPSVFHMNLRPKNVIITQNFTAKLTSFEYSIRSPEGSSNSWKRDLPEDFEEYLPPESADKNAIPSQKWDVYSYGKFWFQVYEDAEVTKNGKCDAKNENEFPPVQEFMAAATEALELKPLSRPSFNDLQQNLAEHSLDCNLREKEKEEIDEKCPKQNAEEPPVVTGLVESNGASENLNNEASRNRTSETNFRHRPKKLIEIVGNGRQNANVRPGNAVAVVRPNMAIRVFDEGYRVYWRLDAVAQRHPVLAFLALLSVVIGVAVVYIGVPNKPPSCRPRPSPANGGSSYCFIDDRNMQMCEYTCPAESVVIPVCASATCLDFDPPITATCVANDTWNLEVPYCQKEISCMPFHAPKEISRSSYCVRGDVKWELYPDQTYTDLKNGTMCSVACWSGYNAEPQSVVSCLSTGEWNLEQPKCKKPVCPHLKLPNYVSAKCNDDNVVGSECKFSCTHGRQMTGPKTAACLNSRTWSSDTPSCQCPRCKTGPNCEYTTSWRQIASNLGSNNKINYAGHEIVCESDLEFLRGQYRCECWGLGRRKRCGLYGSDGGSCEHSLSYFIRDLMADGTLPEPCDKDHMATGC